MPAGGGIGRGGAVPPPPRTWILWHIPRSLESLRVMEQKDSPGHLRGSASCWSFGMVHCKNGDYGVHGLGVGILEEAQICPS